MVASRIQNLHPAWGTLAMSVSGTAMTSLLDPLPQSEVDSAIGIGLLVIATIVATALSIAFTTKLVRYRDNFFQDLANPGFGSQTAAWPAALLILALAMTQAGTSGVLPGDIMLVIGLVFFTAGLAGTLLSGLAFFSRVIGREHIPAQAITASWFVPVVPLVLVPSIAVRIKQLAPAIDDTVAAMVGIVGWGIGFGLFMLLAAIIGGRLLTHEPPAPHAVASWWAWLAPVGAGALGLLALSALVDDALNFGALREIAVFVVTAMWGFALWWSTFAGLIILRQLKKVRFHVGLWGFGFPTAALASLTLEVGRRWEALWISQVGLALWIALLAGALTLSAKTLQGVINRTIWER
jgi:tellurite resistance protein TehA-like permease